MFKQWIFGVALSLCMIGTASAQLAFNEGVDFKRITPAVKTIDADKVVVTEMFWYGCPHCFRFEPHIEQFASQLPDGVVFEQVPSVLNPGWSDHARTYYTLKIMGELDNLHKKFFDTLHLKRKRLDRIDAIASFVADQGVDEAKFRETFNSFPVDALLRKNLQKEKKYGHNGVPTVIVNGKYLTSGSMAGSNERLIQVIRFLVDTELRQ